MTSDASNAAGQNGALLNKNVTNKGSKTSFWEKPKSIWGNITVEPVLLFVILSYFMTTLAIQNLNLEKACRVNLNFDEEVCDAMSNRNTSRFNKSQQETVQKLVASVYIWKNLVHSLCPFILLPLLGSWSDRHQLRKACIIIPIMGEIVTCVFLLLCSYFFYELPLEMTIVAESLPTALTGGITALLMGIFTYIAANTPNETKTFRIGVVHILFDVGITAGFALSGVVYKGVGFYGVFSLAACLYLSGNLYGIFKIKDERKNVDPKSHIGFLRDFFDIKHIVNTFKSVFRKRDGNTRLKIVLVIIVQMFILGPRDGEHNVFYMYTIYKFQWTEINYSLYQTVSCVVNFFGTVFAITVFSKCLKWNDATLGLFAATSKMFASILFALAPTTNIFILGIFLDIFIGVGYTSTRSILSKLVRDDELGKVNSVFGMGEALTPLLYGPLYSAFYKVTIDKFPGAFYFISASLMLPAILILLWLYSQRTEKIHTRREIRQLSTEGC